MLIVDTLVKSYGNKQVLKGVSAEFEKGLVHGIIGLNGAGKTTFFQSICGLVEYTGTISYDGDAFFKNKTSYVPTEPYFFPRIKGKEYLSFMQHAKSADTNCEDLAAKFEVPLEEYIDNYSTGMKRKIAVLGAMIGDTDIYIFDEPFNGVDIKSNLVLKQKIVELKSKGKTVLLSSHIISSLTELCDKIHLLKDGVIRKGYLPDMYHEVETDMISDM